MRYLVAEYTIYDDLSKEICFIGNGSAKKNEGLEKKEMDILEYLILNKGIALSRKQIIENCWEDGYYDETDIERRQALTAHISGIRSKTANGELNKSYIDTVHSHGYRLSVRGIEDSLLEETAENAQYYNESGTQNTPKTEEQANVIRNTLHDLNAMRSKYIHFAENIALHPEDRTHAIKQYLTELERFSVGVNMGAYSMEAIRRSSGGNLINSYKKYMRYYVQERRFAQQLKQNYTINPKNLYNEYEAFIENLYKEYGVQWEPIEDIGEVLLEFLNMPLSNTDAIFHKFEKLDGAVSSGSGKERFVYVPGTREDKCLLVAHMDTVWDKAYISSEENGEICRNVIFDTDECRVYNISDVSGIGADDRAGCAMLWLLRNSGHSLLLLDGEEKKQQGANYMKEKEPSLFQEINQHSFMIQLDRCHGNEYKCYSIPVSDEFKAFIETETGFVPNESKGRTDIIVLCDQICGANMSIGYYNEHTPDEYLDVKEWFHTFCQVRRMLEKTLTQYRIEDN